MYQTGINKRGRMSHGFAFIKDERENAMLATRDKNTFTSGRSVRYLLNGIGHTVRSQGSHHAQLL